MLNDIYCFLRSLVSRRSPSDRGEFIAKFASATPVSAAEVERMKNQLNVNDRDAVRATLLTHVYGIRLALRGTAARKIIRSTSTDKFEAEMLQKFVQASLRKLHKEDEPIIVFRELAELMKDLDVAFHASSPDTKDPFFAVTKRFLQAFRCPWPADIAVMTHITGAIGVNMKATDEMFGALYNNGYRF